MATALSAAVLIFATHAVAQSVSGLGSSGGNGPCGGIGDPEHPVLYPQAYITDAQIPYAPNTTRQLASGRPPRLSYINQTSASACAPVRNVVVNSGPSGSRQEMVGFGHAWTDSAVHVFDELEPALLDQVLEDLFGQTGNNMAFMRHTIGSSDLSGTQYSYDDNGPSFNLGEPDPALAHFSLGPHGTAMAKMIARMGDYKGDVFLFGAPWSYPGWMKQNDLFIAPIENTPGGQHPLLNNSFNIEYIPQAVEYFIRYIDAFKTFGVTVNGLSLQNEPLNYQGGYPCMYLDAADEAQILLQGLGGALHERGAIYMAYDHNTDQPGTKETCPVHLCSTVSNDRLVYPNRVKQGARDLVDAVAWHCYQSPYPNYTVIEDFNHAWPGTPQFMTECTNYLPSGVNFQVAQSFFPPVMHGASGAAMWVMATNPEYGPHSPYGGCAGCEGSIIVNSSTSYTKTNDYYMVGQFSRFVRRGAVNYQILQGVEGSGATSNQFYILAFQNPDESWAIIFMNNLGVDQDVVLSFTSQGGQLWEGTVPNATVTTWLIPSERVLSHNGTTPWQNGTSPWSHHTPPPYPFTNGTTSPFGASGSITSSLLTCSVTTTSTSSTSSSSATVLPVPNTTHTIPVASPPY